MLKFIDENDYTLVDTWKENEDGSISWSYNDGTAKHSGIIREGFTRTVGEATVDVWATLQAKITSGAVAVESVSLDIIKEEAKERINSERDVLIASGVTYNGYTYQTDETSIVDIMGAAMVGVDTEWLTADNVTVTMTAAEMQALGAVVAAHKKNYVYRARAHKDAIEAMTTKDDIETYMSNLTWSD